MYSRILAWRIPWTEEPGGLESMGSQRVRHNWATNTYLSYMPPYYDRGIILSWIRYLSISNFSLICEITYHISDNSLVDWFLCSFIHLLKIEHIIYIRLCARCLVVKKKKKLIYNDGPCPHGIYLFFEIKRWIFSTCSITSKKIFIKYEGIEVYLKLLLLNQSFRVEADFTKTKF